MQQFTTVQPQQFSDIINVYLSFCSHKVNAKKHQKPLKYEWSPEIESDRDANDHNYICVYNSSGQRGFCSSVVMQWSDKHNNEASANEHNRLAERLMYWLF